MRAFSLFFGKELAYAPLALLFIHPHYTLET